ncbi:MAG: 16S rRNA (guanine(966)-N(2))-methyltransferase RsmD [Deltaproteobacteria bacterium]|nr:16S rRNA (guanine(966)-N(2))-methyltransferase RsmD [Deltaproteobacteria bacterium]
MRIVAGRFKGARLPTSRDKGLRPTTERVREALFSSLGARVIHARVLELFAGAGAFGFEALSRGAESVVFVESDRERAQSLVRMSELLRVERSVRVLNMDAVGAVAGLAAQEERFDIVFMDPPYDSAWIAEVCARGQFLDLIHDGGIVVIESDARRSETPFLKEFRKTFSRRYGGTRVEMFERE